MTRPLTGAERATAAWWVALITAGCAWYGFGWAVIRFASDRLEDMQWDGDDA